MSARKQDYAALLKRPEWQRRRLLVMEAANWRCQLCGSKDDTLHCHHSYYEKGKKPWDYPEGSIICICEKCHSKFHEKPKTEEWIRPYPKLKPMRVVPLAEATSYFDRLRALLDQPEAGK